MNEFDKKRFEELDTKREKLVKERIEYAAQSAQIREEYESYKRASKTYPGIMLNKKRMIAREIVRLESEIVKINKEWKPLSRIFFDSKRKSKFELFYDVAKGYIDKDLFIKIFNIAEEHFNNQNHENKRKD